MKKIKNLIKEYKTYIILVFLACILLVIGWKIFWFLTDDAFIAFRYVSNSIKGHGYVWNPAPFAPVEGYTSFLWVFILDIIWRVTSFRPPVSANYISLIFSFFTLIISSLMVFKLSWSSKLKRVRIYITGFFIIFMLSNRTFLTWTSSGLETAMFCFFVILWVYVLIYSESLWYKLFLGNLVAVLIELTRPDGLLFLAGTMVISIYLILKNKGSLKQLRKILIGFIPLLIVLGHFVWRLSFYGEWLPNTYYAKVSTIWPQSGMWYFVSFILEYGLWFIFLFIIIYCFKFLFARPGIQNTFYLKLKQLISDHFVRMVVILILFGHFIYYTFFIGGDFFEYRVYNHFLPLLFILFIWILNQLNFNPRSFIFLLSGFLFLSLPVQWTHWQLASRVDMKINRRQNHYIPISPQWPKIVKWYAGLFDDSQRWLIPHYVCRRYHSHKSFWLYLQSIYPSRQEGEKISNKEFPVYLAKNVGIPAWVLPNINIIDTLGLNDYVIARIPLPKNAVRRMAHDRYRVAPKEYIKGFLPNIGIHKNRVVEKSRKVPIIKNDIIKTEGKWMGYMSNLNKFSSIPLVNKKQIDSSDIKIQTKKIKDLHEYWYQTVHGQWKKIELSIDNLFQLLSPKTIKKYFPKPKNKRIRSKITHPSFEALLIKDKNGEVPSLSVDAEGGKLRFIFILMEYKIDFEGGKISKQVLYCMPYQGKVVLIEF